MHSPFIAEVSASRDYGDMYAFRTRVLFVLGILLASHIFSTGTAHAALEKLIPCWPGFDFTVAPPFGDPQCRFNEANDCGFPPPPLNVKTTQQQADYYSAIIQNDARSQVTGIGQRSGWMNSPNGSPSPCAASTKSTYNVKRVQQNMAAGKCTVTQQNCHVTIIDRAVGPGEISNDNGALSFSLEAAKRSLMDQLTQSLANPAVNGEALEVARTLNQLGLGTDVAGAFALAREHARTELNDLTALETLAGESSPGLQTRALALQTQLSTLARLEELAMSPTRLSAGSIGGAYSNSVPSENWDDFGKFAPNASAHSSFISALNIYSSRPMFTAITETGSSLWGRFKEWVTNLTFW